MIDYKNINEICVPMVKYFNSIGLNTKYSCQGHDDLNHIFFIQFKDSVSDEDIENFLSHYENNYGNNPFNGRFNKWMRKCNGRV